MAGFGEDFGQRIDLTARIREILRNYPEGTSILKELVQNADDAGACEFVITVDERVHGTKTCVDARLCEFQGASLLAYNDARFTERDFQSIQRLGDSLKRDEGGSTTKTGRFGIGFNSVYHVTDLPSFASGSKVVFFDPQAKFLPDVDPSNPGKMVDVIKDAALVARCPDQFAGLRAFGWEPGRSYKGTLFRLPLRTEEQAKTSRLSKRAHPVEKARSLAADFAAQAPELLLFLKAVEVIRVCVWSSEGLTEIARAAITNASPKLRGLRRVPAAEGERDYVVEINGDQRWVVCNQLGGGAASRLAAASPDLRLVPWAGVAARVANARGDLGVRGRAYCFLPLPVRTGLGVHVNGFFEVSSNRRDVWQGDEDLAGDGAARARWNAALAADVAAPCLVRCLARCAKILKGRDYDALWPDAEFFADQRHATAIWRGFAEAAMRGARTSRLPLLATAAGDLVAPGAATCLPAPADGATDDELRAVARVLAAVGEPVVGVEAAAPLREMLATRVASRSATPEFALERLKASSSSSSSSLTKKKVLDDDDDAIAALRYVTRWVVKKKKRDWRLVDGLPLVPLSSGELGTFRYAPALPKNSKLDAMGFGVVQARSAAAHANGNLDAALSKLLANPSPPIPFYFVAHDDRLADAFRHRRTVRARDLSRDSVLSAFLQASESLNLVDLVPRLALPGLAEVALPRDWSKLAPRFEIRANQEEFLWHDDDTPAALWFSKFWDFAARDPKVLSALAEGLPLVPLDRNRGVAALSRRSAVLDNDRRRLDDATERALDRLGVRFLHPSVAGRPASFGDYLFPTTSLASVVAAIDAGLRRTGTTCLLARDEADALRAALSRLEDDGGVDDRLESVAASLRIWPVVGKDDLQPVPSFVPAWTPAPPERRAMLHHPALSYATDLPAAERRLALRLDATDLRRQDFILSRVESVVDDLAFVAVVLRDLPVLAAADASFKAALAGAKFVPTNSGGLLRVRARDLSDPTARLGAVPLAALLPPSAFPSDELADPEILRGLRALGLKRVLDWAAVLEAARAVEKTADVLKAKKLLAALDDPLLQRRLFLLEDDDDDDGGGGGENRRSDGDETASSSSSSWFARVVTMVASDGGKEAARRRAEDRRERIRERDESVAELRDLAWLPVLATNDDDPRRRSKVIAAPRDSRPASDAWSCSASLYVVDADEPRAPALREALAWHLPVAPRIVARELGVLGRKYRGARDPPPHLVSLVLRLYSALDDAIRSSRASNNNGESGADEVRAGLADALDAGSDDLPPCVWVGTAFATADRVAFRGAPADCAPYLHAVPADLVGFGGLLRAFGVREAFGPSDFAALLRALRDEQRENAATSEKKKKRLVAVALGAVRALAADETLTKERCADLDVHLPDETGAISPARQLVYDDAPWLREQQAGGPVEGMRISHPDIAIKVASRLGATSLRRALLDRGNLVSIETATTSSNSRGRPRPQQLFGDDVEVAAYGQQEPLTRRLRHILEMYPEGAGILCEMVQNADDAGASRVRVVLDLRARGSRSLLSTRLAEYQGPCLCVYNDAEFTEADWRNLVRVGQGSKLEKPRTTGRFGLGFNSVYHITDVPQLCSGQYVLFLDPHAAFVPGATTAQPGLRVRFVGAELRVAFPDQFEPWAEFCDLGKEPFRGTLFRLPFRTAVGQSEISRRAYGREDALAVLDHFRQVADEVLVFLRNVTEIDVAVFEDGAEGPRRLFRTRAGERPLGKGWPDLDV
ncbi:hypothetical protein CTAYLR_002440, partial [Chrysophaeum taylorii]